MNNPYLLDEAEVAQRVDESGTVFTLSLRFTDARRHDQYRFAPGQFNMLYLYGVGEVPISISSDPDRRDTFDHTIRVVGRVTQSLARLDRGERVALRGPYGQGWPMERAQGRDIVLVTGGLGCAPVVSVINYVTARRDHFGRLIIMQGIKHSDDMIWRDRYQEWDKMPDTQVLLAADVAGSGWPWRTGMVTALFDQAQFDAGNCEVMMCGPEPMMLAGARQLAHMGVPEDRIWVSLERNMHCAVGHCGHCQFGPYFVCSDGPVFNYREIKWLFGTRGY